MEFENQHHKKKASEHCVVTLTGYAAGSLSGISSPADLECQAIERCRGTFHKWGHLSDEDKLAYFKTVVKNICRTQYTKSHNKKSLVCYDQDELALLLQKSRGNQESDFTTIRNASKMALDYIVQKKIIYTSKTEIKVWDLIISTEMLHEDIAIRLNIKVSRVNNSVYSIKSKLKTFIKTPQGQILYEKVREHFLQEG